MWGRERDEWTVERAPAAASPSRHRCSSRSSHRNRSRRSRSRSTRRSSSNQSRLWRASARRKRLCRHGKAAAKAAKAAKLFVRSLCLNVALAYLDRRTLTKLQLVNKRFYTFNIPTVMEQYTVSCDIPTISFQFAAQVREIEYVIMAVNTWSVPFSPW